MSYHIELTIPDKNNTKLCVIKYTVQAIQAESETEYAKILMNDTRWYCVKETYEELKALLSSAE